MISIIEVYRFDFSEKEKSAKQLQKLFKQYGFPNLYINLEDAYDGYWKVVNKRDGDTIFTGYHSAFVVFYKDATLENSGFIKVMFTYKIKPQKEGSVTFCDKYKEE